MKKVVELAILVLAWTALVNADGLEVFAGAVSGIGNGNIATGCTTYGGPFLSFFNSESFETPVGGITPCGYSGGTNDLMSAGGPLTTSQSVTAGFTGSANSRANYGDLGASAVGSNTIPLSSTVLDDAMGAAFFSDTLTFASPLVVAGGSGFVSYHFTVDGSMSGASGALSEERVLLRISYDSGLVYGIFEARTVSGLAPEINGNTSAPAGYTFGADDLSGIATFDSPLFPLIFGAPAPVEVGLLAEVVGSGSSSFLTTATLTGIVVRDAQGNIISDFTVGSGSGTQYGASGLIPTSPGSAVPEPAWTSALGLGLLAACAFWRTRRRAAGVASL